MKAWGGVQTQSSWEVLVVCVCVCVCARLCPHTGREGEYIQGLPEEIVGDTYFLLLMLPTTWTPSLEHCSWLLTTPLFISLGGERDDLSDHWVQERELGQSDSVILWRGLFLLPSCAVSFTESGFCQELTHCNLPSKSLGSKFSTEGAIGKPLGSYI